MSQISRRTFLQGAPVAAAALGLGASMAHAFENNAGVAVDALFAGSVAEMNPIDESQIVNTYDYDVVVVGAGTAGVPAAMSALEAGATVACIQKEVCPVAQGTGPNGVIPSASSPEALAYLLNSFMHACHQRCDREQMKRFIETSGEVLQWMAPLVTAGGYEVEAKESTAKINGFEYTRVGLSNHGKPDTFGNIISAMAVTAAEAGVDFYYETPGVRLEQDEAGRVTGIIALAPEGYVRFNATKGVILATGDYQNNDAMVAFYCPDLVEFDKKQFGKTGDGHLMGVLAGAVVEPVGHTKMVHDTDSGPMRDEPFLTVNENGERFFDESVLYQYRNDILRNQPKPGWCSQIFDSNYVAQVTEWGGRPTDEEKILNYVPGALEDSKGVFPGLIDTHICDTLEELAEELGIPVDAFVATVERYNELVELGYDADFGKDQKYIQPIAQPPFYGIHKHYRVSAIPAGLLITPDGQCIDAEGNPIQGLFAAGNCSGQFYGSTDYPMDFPGMSLGRCVTFGYITGKYVAGL